MNALLQGRYEIIRTLSDAGGFGETFLAVDRQLPSQRKCVIKKFRPKQQLDARTYEIVRERFEREAAVLEALSEVCHQVPKLYAFFSEAGEYYLVQEFIEGQTLGQYVRAQGRLDEARTRQLLASLLQALHEIHAQGIIHRDIKPDNILLRINTGQPVLIDFGAVKEIITTVLDAYGTPQKASLIIGTPGYTPVEQSVGRPVYGSDLYSLAMTMIFALTGREPRDLNDLASGDLAWRGHTGPLGNELCELLERAAQYDYRARYKNAREMLAALNESQPTRPVMPPPTPRPAPPVINPPTVQVDPTTIPRPAPPRPAQPEPALPQPASKPQPVPAARRSRLPWLVGLLGVPALGLAVYWASNSTPGTIGPSTPTTTSQQPNALPAGRDFTATVNGVKLEMKNVPAGSFTMGSPANEAERSNDEGPQHRVNVPAFAIGKYEITQAQWQAVTGNNPSNFKGANRPVEQVSWNDVTEFCQKLSQLTGKTYRLPTEAEWEYAARAGTNTPFAFGSLLSSTQANFDGNYPYGGAAKGVYRQQTTDVGSFTANAFGLFDMHGNVWEWCEDVWHDNYNSAPLDGSGWLSGGDSSRRVLRGGSWDNDGRSCRSADRYRYEPGNRGLVIGFRVVLAARTP